MGGGGVRGLRAGLLNEVRVLFFPGGERIECLLMESPLVLMQQSTYLGSANLPVEQ